MVLDAGKVSIGVDKVCIAYDYGKSPQAKTEHAQLLELVSSINAKEIPGKTWSVKGRPFTNVCIQLQDAPMFIRYGFASKRHWAWISFNPAKMSDYSLAEMNAYLTTLYCDGVSTLQERARLKRLDIAIDVIGAKYQDHLYVDRRLTPGFGGFAAVGTTYLAPEQSTRQLCCYDKARELHAKSGISVPHDLLRIEARVMNAKKYGLCDLDKISNPFPSLWILDRALAAKIEHPVVTSYLKVVSTGVGPQHAFASLHPSARKLLAQHLHGLQPVWWQPKAIWNGYPKALNWMQVLA